MAILLDGNSSNLLIFGPGLPCIKGSEHRKQRKILNPLFAKANLRNLMPIVNVTLERVRAMTKFLLRAF